MKVAGGGPVLLGPGRVVGPADSEPGNANCIAVCRTGLLEFERLEETDEGQFHA